MGSMIGCLINMHGRAKTSSGTWRCDEFEDWDCHKIIRRKDRIRDMGQKCIERNSSSLEGCEKWSQHTSGSKIRSSEDGFDFGSTEYQYEPGNNFRDQSHSGMFKLKACACSGQGVILPHYMSAIASTETDDWVDELIDDHETFEREDVYAYAKKVVDSPMWDNFDEFVELLRHEQAAGLLRKSAGVVISPLLILSWTVAHGALRCAEALLSGAAGVFVNLDAPRTRYQMPQIHEALVDALPEFVELYIKWSTT